MKAKTKMELVFVSISLVIATGYSFGIFLISYITFESIRLSTLIFSLVFIYVYNCYLLYYAKHMDDLKINNLFPYNEDIEQNNKLTTLENV